MAELMNQRGTTICRGCECVTLVSILNLGEQPLPAEYGNSHKDNLDKFPLNISICSKCGLGQLGEYVLPDRIFHKNYPYLSSASSTWVSHAKNYCTKMIKRLRLTRKDLVVEIASNDGYLLSQFKKKNIPVLGVEPASNVAEISENLGIITINSFFGKDLARDMLKKYNFPKLIVANNVLAHIPDIQDFMSGISILTNEDTIITVENPSFSKLLENTLFDTIYHEHYSYLSAHSVSEIAKKNGLQLIHVEQLSTHGGSNRYWLARSGEADFTVKKTMISEINNGLFDKNTWTLFSKRVNESISEFREWLLEKKKNGDVVVGYGAAHKGNTFLNAVGEASKYLTYVVDASKEKQGKFLPGSGIPVIAPEQLGLCNPTDVLILPWNLATEISKNIRRMLPNARIWIAQPKLLNI